MSSWIQLRQSDVNPVMSVRSRRSEETFSGLRAEVSDDWEVLLDLPLLWVRRNIRPDGSHDLDIWIHRDLTR